MVSPAFAIDLVKTIEAFRARHPRSRVSLRHFANPVVSLALDVLQYQPDDRAIVGVRKCLYHLVIRLEWRSYLGIVPLPFVHTLGEPGIFGGYRAKDPEEVALLVESLVQTTIRYRSSAVSSGTEMLLFFDLVDAVERFCNWIDRRIPLTAAKNDLLVPLVPINDASVLAKN